MSNLLSDVSITLPSDLTREELYSFRPFKDWAANFSKALSLQTRDSHPFHADPYTVRSITVQSLDRWGGRIGFMKISAVVSNSIGQQLPAITFLRGPSVAMLVMLIPDDAPPDLDERYVLLTVQARVAAGSLAFVELPAGMVDDHGSFKGAAAQEIQEELQMAIHEDELVCLSKLAGEAAREGEVEGEGGVGEGAENLADAMFPSAGGCDEHITIYSVEKRVPREQLREWSGRLTGLRDEGEKITLKVVPMKDLWKEGARDAKCLAAVALWEGLRRERKL